MTIHKPPALPTFEESDLLFDFPDDWVVRKYDDTVAYQSLSGHGLKGVDFLALTPDGMLWLIEVKNYRPRISTRTGQEHFAKRRSPENLAQHVARKFYDTARLIRIVDASLRRRWWARVRLWYLEKIGKDRPQSNYWFWSEAHRRVDDPASIMLVLWMETPENRDDYPAAVGRLLIEQIDPGTQLLVLEQDHSVALPFRVRAAWPGWERN